MINILFLIYIYIYILITSTKRQGKSDDYGNTRRLKSHLKKQKGPIFENFSVEW